VDSARFLDLFAWRECSFAWAEIFEWCIAAWRYNGEAQRHRDIKTEVTMSCAPYGLRQCGWVLTYCMSILCRERSGIGNDVWVDGWENRCASKCVYSSVWRIRNSTPRSQYDAGGALKLKWRIDIRIKDFVSPVEAVASTASS